MSTDALADARATLLDALRASRNTDGGWAYYAGRKSRLEPTAWAMLALDEPVDTTPLAGWQRADGLLVEPATGQVNYAFNAIAALAASARGQMAHPLTTRVIDALIDARGEAVEASPAIKQDTSLQGWSWTPGTTSWIEPTAWCMLALKQWRGGDAAARARIDVGEKILRDRVCNGGGWNFGNGEVYGQGLPAHVPPTAIGALAMQDRRGEAILTDAVRFLTQRAEAEGSTTALALSSLAMSVLNTPSPMILSALVRHVPAALAFGNTAAIAMAASATAHSDSDAARTAFALGSRFLA